jgi:hypothetical protein
MIMTVPRVINTRSCERSICEQQQLPNVNEHQNSIPVIQQQLSNNDAVIVGKIRIEEDDASKATTLFKTNGRDKGWVDGIRDMMSIGLLMFSKKRPQILKHHLKNMFSRFAKKVLKVKLLLWMTIMLLRIALLLLPIARILVGIALKLMYLILLMPLLMEWFLLRMVLKTCIIIRCWNTIVLSNVLFKNNHQLGFRRHNKDVF